jgi:hypothetical protein
MTDLIDEIREEIKEERYARLWGKYGNFVIGAAIGIILLTAIVVFISSQRHTTRSEAGSEYYAISSNLKQQNRSDMLESLESMYKGNKTHFAALAGLKRANVLIEENKKDDAIALYKSMSENNTLPLELKSLAALTYVSYVIDGDVNNIDEKELNKILDSLIEDTSPWKYSAQELKGMLALRLGDVEEATSTFQLLSDDFSAPASLRKRAKLLADSIQERQ